ncbi:septum formation initiator, partial [Streptomyces sp. HSW2009]|uniref:septum formation initiator family protein n=1 Tax=Streptomyces sp. HSW2009 TaxID=3142890 RepID=UPI0032EF0C66
MSGQARRTGEGRVPRLIRLRPAGAAGSARRAPFALLIVLLLGSGLITLLLLNSSLNQGSFELSRLERQTNDLTDEEQALQQEVDELAQPDTLQRRARELGLVPGGGPAFLNPDGTVRGVPAPASGRPTTQSGPVTQPPPALRPSATPRATSTPAAPTTSGSPSPPPPAATASGSAGAAAGADAGPRQAEPGAAPTAVP